MSTTAFPATTDRPDDDLDIPVDVVIDHEAAPNDGLIAAVAALLIDLHKKRLARKQSQPTAPNTAA